MRTTSITLCYYRKKLVSDCDSKLAYYAKLHDTKFMGFLLLRWKNVVACSAIWIRY